VAQVPIRYRIANDDNARWAGFPFRRGDIVISTRPRSGTTWMQMICALVIFQSPDLPSPLTELSPWLDWLPIPRSELFARLAGQEHRRFIKTHTPLDGIPLDPQVTYIVVARHPLDMAVSLYHHYANLAVVRIRELAGQRQPEPDGPPAPRPPLREWLLSWIDHDPSPTEKLDSLPGVMRHLTDAWSRRSESNVLLVHYDDLSADLAGEMRRLADALGITIAEENWPGLVAAARFDHMRDHAGRLTQGPHGVLKDDKAFFRRGTSGSGSELLTGAELGRYLARAARLAPAELIAWLHRDQEKPARQ
jgi:aryl sulfotransferase